MARRAVTESMMQDNDEMMPIDINNLNDEEMKALAMAYAMKQGEEGDYDSEQNEDEDYYNEEEDSDIDDIDPENFKGIYYNDDPNRKF